MMTSAGMQLVSKSYSLPRARNKLKGLHRVWRVCQPEQHTETVVERTCLGFALS